MLQMFPGDHFFLHDRLLPFLQVLSQQLSRLIEIIRNTRPSGEKQATEVKRAAAEPVPPH